MTTIEIAEPPARDMTRSLPSSYSKATSRRLRVLVVEDDDADACLIYMALNRHHAVRTILRARDGVQALDMIDGCVVMPDLALIDLNMPRKNGFDLLLSLACRDDVHFPCAVMTSSNARTDEARSRLRGAGHFITKPNSMAELEKVVGELIDTV